MIIEILISACLVISGIFGLVGSFGLLKLPDPMMRLHAPTKATTLGVGGALVASMLYMHFINDNFIAKTHLHLNHKASDLPPTGTDRPWATYESDAMRAQIEAAEDASAN